MNAIKRVSPVAFDMTPVRTEQRDHWEVVLTYQDEGEGPYLVDLSHRTRLDFQSSDLSAEQPFGISIPQAPNASVFQDGILVNRMNRTQASLYHLDGKAREIPDGSGYTDVTEATIFIALIGKVVFSICEKLSALDFKDPDRKAPFLYQGPLAHVPCQIVTLNRNEATTGLVLTCSRGYGKDMISAILSAGTEFGLRPAGEAKFTEWIRGLSL